MLKFLSVTEIGTAKGADAAGFCGVEVERELLEMVNVWVSLQPLCMSKAIAGS